MFCMTNMKGSGLWLMLLLLAGVALIKTISDRYEEIVGSLMSSNIEYLVTDGEIIISRSKSGYKYINNYEILYIYSVDDEWYESDVVNFLGDYSSVDKYLTRYPKGKVVSVYYDSSCPSLSVLEPNKVGYSHFYLPLFLIIVFVHSAYMIFKSWNSRRSSGLE